MASTDNRFEILRDKLTKAMREARDAARAGFGVAAETPDGQPKARPYGQVRLPDNDQQAYEEFRLRKRMGLIDADLH